MALAWSVRRKFLYAAVASVLLSAVLIVVALVFFTTPSTCFDGVANGAERGIDCGGTCALVCRADAKAPLVLWSRAFPVNNGVYTAAAYVQNPNRGAGAKNVPYSFQLFDEENKLVVERTGVMDIPPVETIAFVDPAISVGNRTVARALFAFSEEPVWHMVETLPQLRVGNQFLAQDASVLSATITNDSIENADRVQVMGVLFDKDGLALGASRTVLPRIARKGTQNIIFTWPIGVRNVARADIIVLPSF